MKTQSNQVIDQIMGLVNQLSEEEKEQLLSNIYSGLHNQDSHQKLKQLILEAPTWTEDDYNDFKNAREHFNSSRLA